MTAEMAKSTYTQLLGLKLVTSALDLPSLFVRTIIGATELAYGDEIPFFRGRIGTDLPEVK